MREESAKFRFEHANKNPGKPNFFGKTDSQVAKMQKNLNIAEARSQYPGLIGESEDIANKTRREDLQETGKIDDSKRSENISEFTGFNWGEIKGKEAYEKPEDLTAAIGDKKMLEEIQIDAIAKNTKKNQVPEIPKKGVKENVESNPTLAGNQ